MKHGITAKPAGRNRDQYRVSYVAGNGEVLSTTETVKAKASVRKNAKAHARIILRIVEKYLREHANRPDAGAVDILDLRRTVLREVSAGVRFED